MTPDKLRAWLSRSAQGTTRVRLMHEQLGALVAVCEWSREELEATDGAGLILDAASDYCDSLEASARFLIQRVDEHGAATATLPHRCAPLHASSPNAARADEGNSGAIVAAMLRHDENKERIMVGALGTILSAFGNITKMQTEQLAAQAVELASLRSSDRRRKGRNDEEDEEEARIEAVQKAQIYAKLTDIIPAVTEAITAYARGGRHDA